MPLQVPKDWRYDINYSARTADGRVNFDALPASKEGQYCGVFLIKDEDPLAKPNTDPKYMREVMDELMPQFSNLVDDETLEAVAKKGPSRLPVFRFAGPKLHQGDTTVLLGDAGGSGCGGAVAPPPPPLSPLSYHHHRHALQTLTRRRR